MFANVKNKYSTMINEELLRILEKLQVGDQALVNTHDEVLDLFSVSGCFSFAKYFKENYKFWRYTKDNKETYQSEISGKIMTEEEIFEHWKSNNR
jgi:hypothetical protein